MNIYCKNIINGENTKDVSNYYSSLNIDAIQIESKKSKTNNCFLKKIKDLEDQIHKLLVEGFPTFTT